MPSPFPGMDPYLESPHIGEDFHGNLAGDIQAQLNGSANVEIWPLPLNESLPVIPVPLLEPDPDVPVDLQAAIERIYDRAGYARRSSYREPPPRPDLFSIENQEWLAEFQRQQSRT